MDSKEIPHEHSCTVCKTIIPCDDKFCQTTYWSVCRKQTCIDLYARRTIHRLANSENVLPCCGRNATTETAPGDTMTSDPALVTCKGRPNVRQLAESGLREGQTFSVGPAVDTPGRSFCAHDVPLSEECAECP